MQQAPKSRVFGVEVPARYGPRAAGGRRAAGESVIHCCGYLRKLITVAGILRVRYLDLRKLLTTIQANPSTIPLTD